MLVEILGDWPMWARSGLLIMAALFGGYVLRWIIQWLVQWSIPRSRIPWVHSLARHVATPLGWALSLVLMQLVLPFALPEDWLAVGRRGVWVIQILVVAWLIIGVLAVAEEVIVANLGIEQADNLRARTMQTQLRVVRQIIVIAVLFLAAVAVLMNFEPMRLLGTGMLASAGIAGIILGLAAQRTLSNLIAGFIIAFTQPIRLDDVLIVEGEWGRVEEITLTYVVIRIWDLRRLIVPIGYFLDQPFQNWTRTEARILGSVMIFLDYRVSVGEIRKETHRLVSEHPDWDGEVCGVQVVDATPKVVQVRLLVSAQDSGSAWNLRCALREHIVAWLAEHHPEALPRTRAFLEPWPGDPQ